LEFPGQLAGLGIDGVELSIVVSDVREIACQLS